MAGLSSIYIGIFAINYRFWSRYIPQGMIERGAKCSGVICPKC